MKTIGIAFFAIVVAGCVAVPTPASTPALTQPERRVGPFATGAATVPAPKSTTAPAAPSPAATISPPRPPEQDRVAPALEQLVGQKLVVSMTGTSPSADLLNRIRRGEVGGVILFGSNVTTTAEVVALTARLRLAAAAGGQPPLLIATDQEGGPVRRIPWAPPTLAPPSIGALDSATVARSQGASTGAALRALGIDVDLAPVADVPASTASFMYLEGRTWSFSATVTAGLADAFAAGLQSAGVLPVMKHFPGLGFATLDTDDHAVTLGEPTSALAPGLWPYRTAIGNGIPLIMLSNATYVAYDPANAAGWSPAIATTLLRADLGFTGVTITDSLTGAAAARGTSAADLAVRAASAGTDLLLVTGSEASTRGVYATLLADADGGLIPASALRMSYDRILALKARLASPIPAAGG